MPYLHDIIYLTDEYTIDRNKQLRIFEKVLQINKKMKGKNIWKK